MLLAIRGEVTQMMESSSKYFTMGGGGNLGLRVAPLFYSGTHMAPVYDFPTFRHTRCELPSSTVPYWFSGTSRGAAQIPTTVPRHPCWDALTEHSLMHWLAGGVPVDRPGHLQVFSRYLSSSVWEPVGGLSDPEGRSGRSFATWD